MTITPIAADFDSCYRALQSRDARFDGQFFVAVHTTGIYCRPSCPARTPRPENVHFVLTAAAAQHQGFRACRRCLPDAVPGSPRWNTSADVSARAMRLIADGVVERHGVEGLAGHMGYSPRHLNRVLTAELGVGPLALARAHRATTARILIQSTSMSMSDIAFASGFTSVRQFNDTIRDIFGLPPTGLRRLHPATSTAATSSAPIGLTLRLPYRPPLDEWWLYWFLESHAATGVERIARTARGWSYSRTLSLPHGPALITVEPGPADADRGHVIARLAHLDMRDLAVAVNRIRRLLDLDADIVAAEADLRRTPVLAALVEERPGIRVPGSVDPAETLIRTMIGQQISVKAARHHISALVAELGTRVPWPDGDQWKVFPSAAEIAEHGRDVLRGPTRRIESIVAVAGRLAQNSMELHEGMCASDIQTNLLGEAGIGRWTADYVAMRVTGDPDVLLDRDLVVAQSAAGLGIDLAEHSPTWAPWRSYASMHLWRHRLARNDPILAGDITFVAGHPTDQEITA